MKAAIFREVGSPLSIETIPDPTPGPNELILKVARCGICGSDLHATEDGLMTLPA
ncbi:MAG TPA: alcohol dehydrogenase, partial [Alphaproteobacteria bacterium]|nr:alcohol dehydrogenase [Alphaproteobacteria bacterium]